MCVYTNFIVDTECFGHGLCGLQHVLGLENKIVTCLVFYVYFYAVKSFDKNGWEFIKAYVQCNLTN